MVRSSRQTAKAAAVVEIWGPIERHLWRQVPCMTGRLATEDDVKAGRAVFYLGNPEEVPAWPAEIELPAPALLRDDDSGTLTPVVVIQAEESEIRCTVGIRFLTGGNGLCLLEELEFIDEDDQRFVQLSGGAPSTYGI